MFKVGLLISDPESDARTVAILAAGYLERYLTDLIVSRMPGLNSDLRSRVFDPNGSIGTLGRKIDIARALGLMGAALRQDCIKIARIRNRFAHNIDVDSFDCPDVAEIALALSSDEPYFMGDFPSPDTSTPRGRFTSNVIEICVSLSNELNPNRRGASPDK
jgi:hypothetical protein